MTKMYPKVSDIYDRRNMSKGACTFWSCTQVVPFWQDILIGLCNICDLWIEPDALIGLSGRSEASLAPPDTLQQTLMFSILVAKRTLECWLLVLLVFERP